MSAIPPVPPSDVAPPADGAPAKGGKGRLVGIILGSVLGVAAIGVCIWFFLLKKDPVVEPQAIVPEIRQGEYITPEIRLGEYIKGKRFTYLLPKEAVPEQLQGTAIGQQIANQQVFIQFNTNNIVQYGTMMNGRAVEMERGTYTSEGLTIKLEKGGGTDTATATKAEPAEGDDLTVTDAQGKEIKLSILKVEPAAPLETAGAAALAGLGLGEGAGAMPPGGLAGLAGLLPTAGSPSAGKSKGKGAGYPQSSSVGSRTKWTYGGGGKDLTKWKGQPIRSVIGVFGQPDPSQAKPFGNGGGAWTYNNLNITDAQGNPHKSVTFFIQNGAVVDIKLQTLPPR